MKQYAGLSFFLSSLETQQKSLSILSPYDDLIEIKLLEEAARNIYKEWFVNVRINDEHVGIPLYCDSKS